MRTKRLFEISICLAVLWGVLFIRQGKANNKDNNSFLMQGHRARAADATIPIAKNRTIISGNIHGYNGDSVHIDVWYQYITDRFSEYYSTINASVVSEGGKFKFTLDDLPLFSYLCLYGVGDTMLFSKMKPLFLNPINIVGTYIVEAGDSIYIDFYPDTIIFSGNGKYALEYQYKVEHNNLNNIRLLQQTAISELSVVPGRQVFGYNDMLHSNSNALRYFESDMNVLNLYKPFLTKCFFDLSYQNLLYKYKMRRNNNFWAVYNRLKTVQNDSTLAREVLGVVRAQMASVLDYHRDSILSAGFMPLPSDNKFITKECIMYYSEVASIMNSPEYRSTKVAIKYIERSYSGKIRDLAIAYYAIMDKFGLNQEGIDSLIAKISNKTYSNLVSELFDNSQRGKKAYNFELRDINGDLVKLSDFKGKVVLIDFWFAGCGACRSFYKNILSKIEEEYLGNDKVVFITISVDAVSSVFKRSVAEGIYTSPNLKNVINLTTGKQGVNHPIIKYYKVSGYPQPMIIDRKGNVFAYSKFDLRRKDRLDKNLKEALGN